MNKSILTHPHKKKKKKELSLDLMNFLSSIRLFLHILPIGWLALNDNISKKKKKNEDVYIPIFYN